MELQRYLTTAVLCALPGTALGVALSPFDAHAQRPSADSTAMPGMMKPGPLGIPMERSASGTAWTPDAVSMPSRGFTAGGWNLMLHGFAFAQYDHQGVSRGASQFGSINWAMLMATHDLARGQLQLRTMLSLDAIGVGADGYPELLQTGETFHGQPLHDRQHPHDFFMELAARYERAISKAFGIELYLAPSGEPALGPVAFMHRPSAMDNPMAPIGHHWQDASHTSFGVATAGFFTRRWKVEGSIFNGRDPDPNRWNIDPATFDSYSGRVTFNPASSWSVSAGYGFLHMPEALNPGHTMHHTVVSIQNGRRLGNDGQWATTLLWGAAAHSDQRGLSNSALAESEIILDDRNTVFARAEFVQKTADDLALTTGPAALPPDRSFDVGVVSLGYVREVGRGGGLTFGFGALGSFSVVPAALQAAYGSRTPAGAMVFLRVRALGSHHDNMMSMEGMTDDRPLRGGAVPAIKVRIS